MIVLSTARVLALRQLADENLDLIERGTEPAHMEDFDAVTPSVQGLFATASGIAARSAAGRSVDEIAHRYQDFLEVHRQVRSLGESGDYDAAVDVAVGDQAIASGVLDDALGAEIKWARQQLDLHAERARRPIGTLAVVVVILAVLAAFGAIAGVEPRIREYR